MNIIKSTNFSYLGTRSYVNSSSIIEFIHSNIDIFVDGLPIDYSLDIKMYKEMNINCRVDIHNSYHEYGDESIICEVVLSSDYDTKFIYFLSNHRIINKNTVDPIYHTNEIDLFGEFSGHYRIASNDYNECIKNIIQSNKELHLKNIKLKKYRILNMYMKNVPAEFPKYLSMLNIKITNIGIRDTIDNSFSTLNKINFLEMDLQPILVGFQIVR